MQTQTGRIFPPCSPGLTLKPSSSTSGEVCYETDKQMRHYIHRNYKNGMNNQHSERFTYISIPVDLTVETIRCTIGFFLGIKHAGRDIIRNIISQQCLRYISLHCHELCCTHRFVFVWGSTEKYKIKCSDFRYMTE